MRWTRRVIRGDEGGLGATFEEYRAVFEPAAQIRLREQYETFREVLEPLGLVGWVQSYLNDERGKAPEEPRALYIIGGQAAQLAIGIHESLSHGVGVPAAGNFRTLFELLVAAKLITSADTQDRSDLFMEFRKVLLWHHLEQSRKAGLAVDPTANPATIDADFQAVKGRHGANPTYWWSSIMWRSPKDFHDRKSVGTAGACAYLDAEKVPTGLPGFSSFTELNIRWHNTFSTLSHATVQGANAMMAQGRRALAWQLDPNITRMAPLVLAACAEIIPACEEGLAHPRAGWARMYLADLHDRSILAQKRLEESIPTSI